MLLLATRGIAQEEPVRPALPEPQSAPVQIDVSDAAAVQAELERSRAELETASNAEPKRETLVRVLRQRVELLERRERMLQQRAATEAAAREGPTREEAESTAEDLRAQLENYQPDDVRGTLRALTSVEEIQARVSTEYEAPRAAASQELGRREDQLRKLREERDTAPDRVQAARDALRGMEQKLEQRRQELAAADTDGALLELLRAQIAYRELGVRHHQEEIRWLEQRAIALDGWIATAAARAESARLALELARKRYETARASLERSVARDRRGLQREIQQVQKEFEQAKAKWLQLRKGRKLTNLQASSQLLDVFDQRASLEADLLTLREQLRVAREELAEYRDSYQGAASGALRPSADRVKTLLDRLQDEASLARFNEESSRYEENLRALQRRREQAATSFETLDSRTAEEIAAAKTAFLAAGRSEQEWSTEEAEWQHLVSQQRRTLEELARTLAAVVPLAESRVEERAALRSTRLELIATLKRENMFLRGKNRISQESIAQGIRDLRNLPGWLLGALAAIGAYLGDSSHFGGIGFYLGALLVAVALLLGARRWLSLRVGRLLELDLHDIQVRTALTVTMLLRAGCMAGSLFAIFYLAARLLPDLPAGVTRLLEAAAWIAGGYWLGLRINHELFRPLPPERAVIEVDEKNARRAFWRIEALLLLSVVALPLILSLRFLGYPNEGAMDLLEDVLVGLGGLLVLLVVGQVELFRCLAPEGEERRQRLIRSLLLGFQRVLLILVPVLVVLEILRFELLASLIAGTAVTVLGVSLAGFFLYHAGGFFIDRWLRPKEAADTVDMRQRSERFRLVRGVWRIAVVAGSIWLVLTLGWLQLADVRVFFDQPLPFQGAGVEEKVTWWNLLESALILAVFLLLARYSKLFLTAVVFPSTRLDKGLQYTIQALTGYVLVGLGAYLALVKIFSLENLGYVIAALSVGIGFGLQEVVSNFISGLILLFERPLQVGDVVQVGDTEGEVQRITIRSTTIKTLDNIFILVPNKDLITQNVVNYTHFDPKLRVRVPVGVAYGSDTALVRECLLGVASQHGLVLKRPKPQAQFLGFGDSSLDFELRVWVADPDHRIQVRSDLNFAVDASFRKFGVEIPFPQRDLHIRSSEPIPFYQADATPSSDPAAAAEPEEHAAGDEEHRG